MNTIGISRVIIPEPEIKPYITVKMVGHGRGKVFVGGTELIGVRSIQFSTEVNGMNILNIEIIPEKVVFEGTKEFILNYKK